MKPLTNLKYATLKAPWTRPFLKMKQTIIHPGQKQVSFSLPCPQPNQKALTSHLEERIIIPA